MAVKVLITRRVKEGKELDALNIMGKLRTAAVGREGYITGESLFSLDDPQKVVVISTWKGTHAWEDWASSPERAELDEAFKAILMEPAATEMFGYGSYFEN